MSSAGRRAQGGQLGVVLDVLSPWLMSIQYIQRHACLAPSCCSWCGEEAWALQRRARTDAADANYERPRLVGRFKESRMQLTSAERFVESRTDEADDLHELFAALALQLGGLQPASR